jgi:IrrE N-terminal-like domain
MNEVSGDLFCSVLEDMAKQLRPVTRSPFVPVIKLAKDLGIEVELCIYSGSTKRDAQSDVSSANSRIVLYRKGSAAGVIRLTAENEHLLKPRERFSVAHELGHILAYKHLDAVPLSEKSDRSGYWKQEEYINAFAESLLIPSWLAEQWLTKVPEDKPVSISNLRSWAYDQCRVSFEVAARALARIGSYIGFIKIEEGKRVSTNTRLFAVRYSTSGQKLTLPNLHSFIEDSRFIDKIIGPYGTQRVHTCQLGAVRCENLDVTWQESPSSDTNSVRRFQPAIKFSGKMYWISVRMDSAQRDIANTRNPVQLNLFE